MIFSCSREQKMGAAGDGACAFTLVELLAVVAVTGVLAALLFPVYQSAIRASHKATCMSNLRQLGGYISVWSSENNGDLLPTLRRTNPINGAGTVWHELLSSSSVLPNTEWHQKKSSVMRCPARKDNNPRFPNPYPSRQPECVHYGMNTFPGVNNMIAVGAPFNKLAAIPNPSRTMLLGEAEWNYQLYPHIDRARIEPHQGGSNVLFVDGHIETYPERLPVYPNTNPGVRTPFY